MTKDASDRITYNATQGPGVCADCGADVAYPLIAIYGGEESDTQVCRVCALVQSGMPRDEAERRLAG